MLKKELTLPATATWLDWVNFYIMIGLIFSPMQPNLVSSPIFPSLPRRMNGQPTLQL
jgi:hypothetical protein